MNPDAIVIGAGPAGLACAASLGAAALKVRVLEKADNVGAVWRRHYDRLHLHTDRNHSSLPGMAMPRNYPLYPSREQVIAYLEAYAAHFGIQPSFNTNVREIARAGSEWRVDARATSVSAPIVVVATGWADFPYSPSWPGLNAFAGSVFHSSEYRNPAPYAGKRVLVVGFGNSGGEIALDLANAGIDVSLAVRGPIQILPRDLLGLPILYWAILQKPLPARVSDFINAPLIHLVMGSVDRLGLKLSPKGPRQMIEEDGRVPMIDVGTLAKIKEGAIKVRGGVDHFTSDGVAFEHLASEKFDAVILATGFRPDLRNLLPGAKAVLNAHGIPLANGRETTEPGLYFCGLVASPTGQLREIGLEARRIAALARRYCDSRALHGS